MYNGAQLTIRGSNVTKDFTEVQLQCSNCTTWTGGSVDIESSSGSFIWAYGETAPSDPSNPASPFQQHQDHGNFKLNLKAAQTNSNNPPTISVGSSDGLFGLSHRQLVSSD